MLREAVPSARAELDRNSGIERLVGQVSETVSASSASFVASTVARA
jgi:hypothetical protein